MKIIFLTLLMLTCYKTTFHTNKKLCEIDMYFCKNTMEKQEAGSFSSFIKHFIDNERFWYTHTSENIKVYTIELEKADQANIYSERLIERNQVWDYINTIKKFTPIIRLDYFINGKAKTTISSLPEHEYNITLLFTKEEDHWMLSDIHNNTINISTDSNNWNSSKLKKCLTSSEAFLRNAETNIPSAYLFNRALYSLICAAENGSSEAAVNAVALGTSGQSHYLSVNQIEALLEISIEAGDIVSYASLADLKCLDMYYIIPNEEVKLCKYPEESFFYKSKAISSGFYFSAYTLGEWLEKGMLGKVYAKEALACYKLAFQNNIQLATDPYNRLKQLFTEDEEIQCPSSIDIKLTK